MDCKMGRGPQYRSGDGAKNSEKGCWSRWERRGEITRTLIKKKKRRTARGGATHKDSRIQGNFKREKWTT